MARRALTRAQRIRNKHAGGAPGPSTQFMMVCGAHAAGRNNPEHAVHHATQLKGKLARIQEARLGPAPNLGWLLTGLPEEQENVAVRADGWRRLAPLGHLPERTLRPGLSRQGGAVQWLTAPYKAREPSRQPAKAQAPSLTALGAGSQRPARPPLQLHNGCHAATPLRHAACTA